MSIYEKYLAGVILAGGENKRFPSLKGFIKINGITIIERNLTILKSLFKEVFISANSNHQYLEFNTRIIEDLLPSRGPITGIYSCLLKSKSSSVFVITCDMPFVEEALVRYICDYYLKLLEDKISFDALIPRYDDKVEPLLGIYSKSSLLSMEKAITQQKVMMRLFLEEINTHYIDLSNIIDKCESWRISFENINTLYDFEKYSDKGLEL